MPSILTEGFMVFRIQQDRGEAILYRDLPWEGQWYLSQSSSLSDPPLALAFIIASLHYLAEFLEKIDDIPSCHFLSKSTLFLSFPSVICTMLLLGTGGTQWLRHWATNRKVVGSIPDGVIGIFHSGHTMALGSTQPLTEMSTRNISWGKGRRCVALTTLLTSCADCLEIWEPQPLGNLRACQGL
jgi:hypothetical protein